LFAISRPAHISRFVVAVIIDAINGKVWRGTFANNGDNVSKKNGKIIPAIVDFDAAGSVPSVIGICGVRAALMHVCPCVVEIVPFLSRVVAMTETAVVASARCGVASSKVAKTDNVLLLAATMTKPKSVSMDVLADRTDGYETAKWLPCDIYSFGHRAAPTVRGSSGGLMLEASVPLRTLA
jgi:hypothetical protein